MLSAAGVRFKAPLRGFPYLAAPKRAGALSNGMHPGRGFLSPLGPSKAGPGGGRKERLGEQNPPLPAARGEEGGSVPSGCCQRPLQDLSGCHNRTFVTVKKTAPAAGAYRKDGKHSMKDPRLIGIFPALLTAFDSDGVDTAKVKALSSRLVDKGVKGLYVGGSSGEMALMSVEERMTLLEAVCDAVGESCTVIAHVGAMSLRDTLALARHAEGCRVRALSSVTPLYYKYSFREVKGYYEALAAQTSLPVIIYNIPALTGMSLNAEQLGELLRIPNVGGMKFTSSDFFLLERLRSGFPDKVFYNGSDEMLLSGLAAGADGGIGTTYNFMPEKFLKIYQLYQQGEMKQALAIQGEANRVIQVLLKNGVLPSSKELLRLSGLDYGVCRAPFLPLERQALEELKAEADILFASDGSRACAGI